MPMRPPKTLARPVELEGLGVHSGRPVRLRLVPSPDGEIVFRRSDLGGAARGLRPDRVESRNSTTLVGEHFKVQTVEHLLAALFAFGVDSLVVDLDADEVPIMDGSARPFVEALRRAGFADLPHPRPAIRVTKTVQCGEGDAWVRLEPAPDGGGLFLDYTIAYGHPVIGTQHLGVRLTPESFAADIAPARTFGFLKDVEFYHKQGLALGASYDNTVVLDEAAVVNPPLRFADEFVRHKLLDIAGDLALLGRPLTARVTAHKAGHRLHLETVRYLLAHPEYWIEE
jgi:UDP-3-O-[3-hydroxymyristoyl] N-acetylglucosamine deacetylase